MDTETGGGGCPSGFLAAGVGLVYPRGVGKINPSGWHGGDNHSTAARRTYVDGLAVWRERANRTELSDEFVQLLNTDLTLNVPILIQNSYSG